MQKLGVVSFSVKSESIRLCKVIGFLFLSLLALCGLAVPRLLAEPVICERLVQIAMPAELGTGRARDPPQTLTWIFM